MEIDWAAQHEVRLAVSPVTCAPKLPPGGGGPAPRRGGSGHATGTGPADWTRSNHYVRVRFQIPPHAVAHVIEEDSHTLPAREAKRRHKVAVPRHNYYEVHHLA